MRAIHVLALAALSSVPFASSAVVAGEATYLAPPLFRELARDTQKVRNFTYLSTTPQPVAAVKPVTKAHALEVDGDVVTIGAF